MRVGRTAHSNESQATRYQRGAGRLEGVGGTEMKITGFKVGRNKNIDLYQENDYQPYGKDEGMSAECGCGKWIEKGESFYTLKDKEDGNCSIKCAEDNYQFIS